MAKRLELLKDTIPDLRRAAVLVKPDNPLFNATLLVIHRAADALKVDLQEFEARDPIQFEPAIAAMVKNRVEGITVQEDAVYPPARTADWRLRVFYLAVACFLICLGSRKETAAQDLDKSLGGALTCAMIEDAARSNSLPVSFFTRLLWQESGFQSDAIGPVTRSGARALGIAQFMPATAAERGLLEPFNPVEALPKSGRFLAELRYQFGNLGLAAAAYNAGPQRVREFLAGSRNLPSETRNYVFKITGHSVDDWRVNKRRSPDEEVRLDLSQLDEGGENCRDIVAKLKKSRSVGLSPPRAVPSWCRHLNQPKSSVCGLVRQQSSAMQTARLVNTKSSRVSKILPR